MNANLYCYVIEQLKTAIKILSETEEKTEVERKKEEVKRILKGVQNTMIDWF